MFKTPPLNIIDWPADADHKGDNRIWPPKYIYVHHTGGTDSRDWLSKTSRPVVSCHRLISKNGTIYKIVDDRDVAYTQGFGVLGARNQNVMNLNRDGLSIELENVGNGRDPYPDIQVWSCALQVREWIGLYGWLPILSHKDVDPRKNDPTGFPWTTFNNMLAAALAEVLPR